MEKIELYSASLCPYAYRSRLTLAEKHIPYTQIDIDLQHKPANFLEISPSGKVPLLVHGDRQIWESAIINEYLEEIFPHPPLFPVDPYRRAQARIWINFADTHLFATAHQLLVSTEPQQRSRCLQELTAHLQFIDRGLQTLAPDGVYWFGDRLTLVDLTYYPWFEQIGVLEQIYGFQLPSQLNRLARWLAAIADRQSVRQLAQPIAAYLASYAQLGLKPQSL